MFHRFIVATDLSPSSFAVVSRVGGLKALGARKCLLLLCLSFLEASSLTMASKMDLLESRLAEQKRILEGEGFATSTRFVLGFAKTEIERIAEDQDYSLIVVGSRGHRLVGEAFLGGVAYWVIHSAKRPVLLVRIEMKTEEGGDCADIAPCHFAKHILFPTDFSENADHAFSYLKDIVSRGVDRVTLLHVQDETRIDSQLIHRIGEFNEIDRGRLEKMKAELEKLRNAQIQIEISYGTPIQEVLRVIREKDVHTVVMGSQGRGFVKEIFLGSVSHSIARLSSAAVILIPAIR